MTAEQRRQEILSILNSKGTIRTSELASTFNVTSETIRKDLVYLKNKKLLRRNHGSIESIIDLKEQPLQERLTENINAKQMIARKAMEQLDNNSVIFLDIGSTLLELAKLIAFHPGIAIITNSFTTVEYLLKGDNPIYFMGGEISPITHGTTGIWAINALRSMRIDIAFLGTSGFQSHKGPCTKLFSDSQLKTDIINNSNKCIVLADHTKFSTNAIMQYTDWANIDLLITDNEVTHEQLEDVQQYVDVVVADEC